MSSYPNRPSVQARDKQFITGINKRLTTVQSLAIAGTTYTPAQLIQLFQSQIDSADAVAIAKAKYQDAVKAYRDQAKQLVSVTSGFQSQIRNLYGNASEPLSDFGMSPRKVAKPKLATKVVAVDKAKATRKARGTLGPKKRKSIKGTVPATTTTNPQVTTAVTTTVTPKAAS
jgi:hypothetical protein